MKRFHRFLMLLVAGIAALTAYGKPADGRTAEEKAEVARAKNNLEVIHRQSRPTNEDYIPTLRRLFADKFMHEICPNGKDEDVHFSPNWQYSLNELAFVWQDLLRWKDITAEEYAEICYNYVACIPDDFECLVIDPEHTANEGETESFAYQCGADYSAYIDFLHAHQQLLKRVGMFQNDESVIQLIGGLQWKAATYMYEHNGKTDPYHWLDSAYMYSMDWLRAYPISEVTDIHFISDNLLAVMCRMSKEGYSRDVQAYLQGWYNLCSKAIEENNTNVEWNESYMNYMNALILKSQVLILQAEGELLNGNGSKAVSLQKEACRIVDVLRDENIDFGYEDTYTELLTIAIAAKDKNTVDQLKAENKISQESRYWAYINLRYNATPYRNQLEKLLMKNVKKIYGEDIKRDYSKKMQEIECERMWISDNNNNWVDDDDEDDYESEDEWDPEKTGKFYCFLDESNLTACVADIAPEEENDNVREYDDEEEVDEEEEVESKKPNKPNKPNKPTTLKILRIPETIKHNGKTYTVTSVNDYTWHQAVASVYIPATVREVYVGSTYDKCMMTKFIVDPKNKYLCSVDGVLMSKDKTKLIGFPAARTKPYVIPKTVTHICKNAFAGSRLTSLTIPEGITRMGANALNKAKNLKTVVWNAKRCTLGDSYSEVLPKSVEDVVIGKDVERIPERFCMGLETLKTITIPENVTMIGYKAFKDCYALCCTIPGKNLDIAGNAFENVPSIAYHPDNQNDEEEFEDESEDEDEADEQVTTFGALSMNGYIDGNWIYSDDTKTELVACLPNGDETLIIPEGVKRIGNRALYNIKRCKRLVIPESVTEIGESLCFSVNTVYWNSRRCADIEHEDHRPFVFVSDSFVIGNRVEHVPAILCFNMHMRTLVISEGVKSIGRYAFSNCHHLKSVLIPSSVDSIAPAVFSGCDLLTSIDVASDNPNYCTVAGALMSKDQRTLIAYPSSLKGRYSIPEGVTRIAELAFEFCLLDSIDIPMSTTHIERLAFDRCRKLTEIVVPEGVEYVGQNAFNGCTSLASVRWNARRCEDFDAYYAAPFFTICEQITSFEFGEAVETVPAFLCIDMQNLPSVSLPSSLTYIGKQAFMNCSAMTEISFPNRMKQIGGMAFDGCSGLQAVTCLAPTPPEMLSVMFDDNENVYGVFNVVGSAIQNISLSVPAKSIAAYKQAAQWNDFETIQAQ